MRRGGSSTTRRDAQPAPRAFTGGWRSGCMGGRSVKRERLYIAAFAAACFVAGALILAKQARGLGVPDHIKRGFLCIHSHEGAWDANTGNGYFGGLQMDHGFMRTYATWLLRNVGTADRWRVDQQIRVAYRA